MTVVDLMTAVAVGLIETTSPSDSSGITSSRSSSGSSNTGLHLGATVLKARMPAILNDISFESTV